jgi:hypothetical protein
VKSDSLVRDGDKPVQMPPGWKITDYNYRRWDIEFNPWQSEYLACHNNGGPKIYSFGTSMCSNIDLRGNAVLQIKKKLILTSP